MAETGAKRAAPAGPAETPKVAVVHTPADQVHIVAAILATAASPQVQSGNTPAKASTALVQRYRHIFRILTRGEGSDGEDQD